mmetsp:Transcript_23435/g.30429  ORF Transcript_23435/g.30429 Transcript_23435/m.30429 type:complete len:264 (+) Transcript_23435:14-805(+)
MIRSYLFVLLCLIIVEGRRSPELGASPSWRQRRRIEEENDDNDDHLRQGRGVPIPPREPWQKQLIDTLPQVKLRIDPLTSLKIRKHFHWLRTTLSVGADYSTQEGTWTMKYSWEDSLIGGKLSLKGSELQLHKNWIFNFGPNSPLCANLRLRAAIDVATGQMSARFGFRTEQSANAINIVDGIDLVKNLPLDGPDGHAKLQVKLRLAFPQPDISLDKGYSNQQQNGGVSLAGSSSSSNNEQGVFLGMGDLELDLDEVNLCLDW